jgi:hypothetical protein
VITLSFGVLLLIMFNWLIKSSSFLGNGLFGAREDFVFTLISTGVSIP